MNLTRELALSQFKLKYTGSALGYVWSLLKPLAYFGVMYGVFVYLFKADRASPNFAIQLLLGIVLWTFFIETTSSAVGAIAANGHMIRKAYFPRVILVIASSMTALITFAINLALVILIAGALGRLDLGVGTLAVVPLLLQVYILILGCSLLISSLFVFYRDVGHLWEIFTQILFYASAVVYPLALIPGHILPRLVMMNPMAQVIEDFRHALVTGRVPWSVQVLGWFSLIPLAITLLSLVVGAWVFHRLTPRFAEDL